MDDAILYWNEVVNEADRTTHTTLAGQEAGSQGPCGSSRAYAIVHLAMHDAYFSINTKYDTYLADLPPVPPGADPDAAVAAAAHATLSALYPTQKAFFDARHAAAGLSAGQAGVDGHVFGQAVAAKILAARQNDPTLRDDGYSSSVARRRHRQDPDNAGQGFYAPFYGAQSGCFAATDRHHLNDAPQLDSPEYLQALAEVRSKGIAPQLIGTVPDNPLFPPRTPTETAIGIFWGYDGAKNLGTPPRLYNQIVREVAKAQGNDIADNARLFAVVNAAMGDAGILAWDDKYVYDVWRPVLGPGRQRRPGLAPARCAKDERAGQEELHPAVPGLPVGPRHIRRGGLPVRPEIL
ncbi:MAG: hypothetical protein LC799_05080 [Actinobacteria bacterium]|nr:hypothetical protein [Actinomycetota bacterium]